MLTTQDYEDAALKLGCSVAGIKAVAEVESAGAGFWAVGKPKVLFERHRMYKLLAKSYGLVRANELALAHPTLVKPQAGGYTKSSETEQLRIEQARLIDNSIGLQAASWGMFQILAEHYAICGFNNPVAFVLAMSKSEKSQLDIFVRFIQANPRLVQALRACNWEAFAEGYNGKNFRAGQYHVKMAKAYLKYR